MKIKGVDIEWLGHSGFFITSSDGKKIAIDPYNIEVNSLKADVILITHSHYDHCSIGDIIKLSKPETEIVIPISAQSKLNRIEGIHTRLATVGIKLKAGGISIYPFPAYNLNKPNHPKEENWMGYLIKIGDIVIYHAGDTDKIPEMENLKYIKQQGEEMIALLPVSGEYVMNAEEAAEAAELIKPELAIPMHYGSGVIGTKEDAEKFARLCNEKGINAKIIEKM